MRYVLALAALAACGSTPPVKTASGEQLDAVTIEERFKRTDDVHATTLRSDRLRRAVALMDKHGVTPLSGTFESRAVLDAASVEIVVKPTSGSERRIVVKNCAHSNVCPFLKDAASSGLLERVPVPCKSDVACQPR